MSAERATPFPAQQATRTIADGEFQLFQELIYRVAGIRITDTKKDLLVTRLSPRLRDLGLSSFSAYYRLVKSADGEIERMLDRVCTNETHFFREPRHFEYLERQLFPQWAAQAAAGKRPRRIHVWSCACSTGEEPYSLAMSLLAHLPKADGWELRVLATDLSTSALTKAAKATWPLERASEIPGVYLKTFMLRGTRTQHGRMRAGEEIRRLVRFDRFNLNADTYPYGRAFDLVFCRNVLIYFDTVSRKRALDKLAGCLVPGGLLFLGHAESATGATPKLRVVEPTIFTATP